MGGKKIVLKLLVTLGVFLLVALVVFGLRQQRLEVTAQSYRIVQTIEARKDTLHNQRVAISRESSSRALAMGMKAAGMDTGDAFQLREGRTGRVRSPSRQAPAVETDLLAPLRH